MATPNIAAVSDYLLDLHGRETIGVVWNEEVLLGYVGNAGLFMLKLIASG